MKETMRRNAIIAIASAVALAVLPSCQQLFTSSVMAGLANPTVALPANLTAQQAADLADQAQSSGDPALAEALLGQLDGMIAAETDPTALVALQGTAAECAVTASGAADALTGIIGTLQSGVPPTLADINGLIAGVNTSADVINALTYLTDPAVPATGETYMLAAITVITSAAGGDVTTLPTDPAVWAADPVLSVAMDLVQSGVTAFTASGYDPGMISLIQNLGGLVP